MLKIIHFIKIKPLYERQKFNLEAQEGFQIQESENQNRLTTYKQDYSRENLGSHSEIPSKMAPGELLTLVVSSPK